MIRSENVDGLFGYINIRRKFEAFHVRKKFLYCLVLCSCHSHDEETMMVILQEIAVCVFLAVYL